MIIEIYQIKATAKNLFEVFENSTLLYRAHTPWLSIKAPLPIERFFSLSLSDANDRTLFTTKYAPFENDSPIPSLHANRCNVISNYGRVGYFCVRPTVFGTREKQFDIVYQDRFVTGYDASIGNRRAVSFYDAGAQVAQLTSPLAAQNNLNSYFLHIAPGHEALLPILVFFAIYFDYLYYNNSGEFVSNSATVSWQYSFKTDHYDPDWIKNTFGEQEACRLESAINACRDTSINQIKRSMKLFAIFGGIIAIAVLVIFALSYFNNR